LINHPNLFGHLRASAAYGKGEPKLAGEALVPLLGQEVWAAGVTYLRSRSARMDESQDAGGGSFYDRVYSAERPELFFKAAPWRVRGPGQRIRVRRDSKWSVPEPELAVCINARAEIVGYTIGNDVSSRDIEGENPLYLPQAKTYDGSCALGPALFVSEAPLAPETKISLAISRSHEVVFEGSTTLAQMRRTPEELVEFLYRETSFPLGCVLLTGTGVVPPDDFTLQSRDEVRIEIAGIGVLVNCVE
jgi:2-dehydro-3-deoxy-D-arabinonate dehydratase